MNFKKPVPEFIESEKKIGKLLKPKRLKSSHRKLIKPGHQVVGIHCVVEVKFIKTLKSLTFEKPVPEFIESLKQVHRVVKLRKQHILEFIKSLNFRSKSLK